MQAIILWSSVALVAFVLVYALLDWKFPGAVARFEENALAILLGLLTLIAFTQVIARYGFNSGWTGALELQRILFAWLILFGMSYGVRTGSHLGVDALIRLMPRPVFRALAVFGAVACLAYAAALLSAFWLNWLGAQAKGGAIAYWGLNWRTGLGLDELRYPDFMQDAFGLQERVHRWLAYLILPIGLGLFLFRSLQAIWEIATGKRELIIASHEAEDLVEENRGVLAGEGTGRPVPAALSDDGPGLAIVDAGSAMARASRSPMGSAMGDRDRALGAIDPPPQPKPARPRGDNPVPPPPPRPKGGKRRARRLRGKGAELGGRDRGPGGED